MTEPIRVLHFADIHVGMENYGRTDEETGLSSRVRDFLRRLEEMIDYAREHDVDLVIFAGDAFKTRAPNPTYQREFAYRIQDLAELAPTVLLVGNHDLTPNILRASSVEIYDTLRVPNVYVAQEYKIIPIETKRGLVVVGTAPYPIRSHILSGESTQGMTISAVDLRVQERLSEEIDRLATEAEAYDAPRILTGHFTVGGAVLGSERNIMLGRDVSVGLSFLADDRWDYVALGHIHKHQNLTKNRDYGPPVVYSGSMERIDFGEEGDPKGFCWVELERKNTSWSFVEVDARPFVTIRADLRKEDNPTHEIIAKVRQYQLEGAVVRMILQLTPEQESQLNEPAIRATLRGQGTFFIAAIKKEVEQPARMRLGASPEGLTPIQLLDRYLKSKQVPKERRDTLMEAAEGIFDDVEE